jgi:3-phosphoshikimate 1-carboxyvinyltransferase
MEAIIEKSNIKGNVIIPSSKSYTHRALICAALANGKSKISSPLISDDTEATISVLRKLGIEIKVNEDSIEIDGGKFREPKEDLFCGESGTTMRLMTAICSSIEGRCKLTGGQSLSNRPMKTLVDGLKQLGVNCYCNDQLPPVIVEGGLEGGVVEIPGNISSQFISGLLLVAPLAKQDVTIKLTTELESKSYVLMTIETQRVFGINVIISEDFRKFYVKKQDYKTNSFKVEGDWSSASFLLASGVFSGQVEIENLNIKSLQADREIMKILEKMKAMIKIENDFIISEKSELYSIEFDVSDHPDIFPILCVLSANAKNKSIITGVRRLKIKESNRVEAMKEGLIRMGINFIESNGKIMIEGGTPKGAIIDSKNDHRIAMAFAVLGLVAKGETIITNAECVSKSFPDFWDVMKKINAKVKTNE